MLIDDNLLFSYLRCSRRAFLNIYGDLSLQDTEQDFVGKLREENVKYSLDVTNILTPIYHEPQTAEIDLNARFEETKLLMSRGVEYIHNGILLFDNIEHTFIGNPTLLVKEKGFSELGPWVYYPINVNLGRRPKLEYKIISTFHSYLLTFIQEILPPKSEIILRPFASHSVNLSIFIPQLTKILGELTTMLVQQAEPEVFISRQKCSLCRWYSHCKAIAKSQNHLSLIPGVTPNRYKNLQSLKITTIELLASDSSPQLDELLGADIADQIRQQAQAIIEQKPILKYPKIFSNLPSSPINLYFDIEAEPDHNLDYLLGVLVVDDNNNSKKFYPFLAEKPEQEKLIWQQFLQLVNQYPQAPIFHYSNYEIETIKRLANLYNTPIVETRKVLSRCIDLHKQVIDSVILPVESYSLKSIANWLGFTWTIPEAKGDQSVCWYDQWLKTGNNRLLENILSYNQDDCLATYHLKEWLGKFLACS
jgi:uncharacterized protein